MLTLGIDAHKQLHVAIAVDEAGREVGRWQGANNHAGWDAVARWAADLGTMRQWGIQGAWNYGRGLAQYLVRRGETVYEINPRWTALGRRRARRPGKNDVLDAHAIAAVVQREGPVLPTVAADDECSVLDLLTTEREDVLAEATRLRNQLHALLLQFAPDYRSAYPKLDTDAALEEPVQLVAPTPDRVAQARTDAVHRLVERLRLALRQAADLATQIRSGAKERFTPLTRLCGVNLLTAGALAGILGPGRRFRNDSQLAAYAGVAPLETSSAGHVRHRLNRGGNRRLNAILYRIAITQARHAAPAQEYLQKTRREAYRALKRFLVRAIWRLWQECWGVAPLRATGA